METRSMFYDAKGEIFEKARMLRRNQTPAERALWLQLNKKQIFGLRFKRQHPILHYIADFYNHKLKLVIEIDEQYHERKEQKQKDKIRDKTMSDLGITVIRIEDKMVLKDISRVIEDLEKLLTELMKTTVQTEKSGRNLPR